MTRTIAGQGLHTATHATLRFERIAGPAVLRVFTDEARIRDLQVVGSTRSTAIGAADSAMRVSTIEHVFAALGGLGIHDGVAVVLDGVEVPLADGGARAFVDALTTLDLEPSSPPLHIVREGSVRVGDSHYELTPPSTSEDGGTILDVHVEFGDARLAERAVWSGDPDDFRDRIAVARTFGFEHEVEDLLARGLASHVTPESVVVIGPRAVLSAGMPFLPDEPARHKLLDLVGDLYLHGGPPRGRIRASRPGHAATHEAMRRAFEEGIVRRR